MREECSNCRFVARGGYECTGHQKYECHFDPPTVGTASTVGLSGTKFNTLKPRWPEVSSSEWCGKYEAKHDNR